MIVYNGAREWFSEKLPASQYRVAQGLPPSALSKITVSDRNDLAALLNALMWGVAKTDPQLDQVAARAYVDASVEIPDCVPRFLLDPASQKEWDRRHLK
jgi:hypothetical protein